MVRAPVPGLGPVGWKSVALQIEAQKVTTQSYLGRLRSGHEVRAPPWRRKEDGTRRMTLASSGESVARGPCPRWPSARVLPPLRPVRVLGPLAPPWPSAPSSSELEPRLLSPRRARLQHRGQRLAAAVQRLRAAHRSGHPAHAPTRPTSSPSTASSTRTGRVGLRLSHSSRSEPAAQLNPPPEHSPHPFRAPWPPFQDFHPPEASKAFSGCLLFTGFSIIQSAITESLYVLNPMLRISSLSKNYRNKKDRVPALEDSEIFRNMFMCMYLCNADNRSDYKGQQRTFL